MAPEAPREQEQSIKARKHQIFEEEEDFGPRRPFSAYLSETEAAPLTAGQKAALWGVGVLVFVLLTAALLTMPGPRSRHPGQVPAKSSAPGAVAH